MIPTLNAAATLPRCLAALTPATAEGLVTEMVVVDAGSADPTREVAKAAGATVLTMLGGRGPQLAAGCARATAPWLLALHADTVLRPGWEAAVAEHTATRPDAAGWFRLRFDDASLAADAWSLGVGLRARLGMPYGDQGLLISRGLYDAVGGYRPLPLMEDVDLARRLGRRRLVGLRAEALTDASKYRRDGWLVRSARNCALVARYLAGADPNALAERYE